MGQSTENASDRKHGVQCSKLISEIEAEEDNMESVSECRE